MLRITMTETTSEQRWILQGRLTGSTIEELITSWRANRICPTAQSCVVDLNEITSIDKDGEQILLMMIRDGAKFVATGLYTKHLLESLSAQNELRRDSL
jgi:ABC-type transporter Mla MlaB component